MSPPLIGYFSIYQGKGFDFLHPNCKRLIAMLQALRRYAPIQAAAWVKPRVPILCVCCGAVMMIVRTRIRSGHSEGMSPPIAPEGVH